MIILGDQPAGTLDLERALPIDEAVHPAYWTFMRAVKPDARLRPRTRRDLTRLMHETAKTCNLVNRAGIE
jgi:hypothetical protein